MPGPRNKGAKSMLQGLVLGLVGAVLASCSLAPEYVKPDQPMPADYRGRSEVADALPELPTKWWESFGSAELNRLEETALANNFSLKAATARVAQALANAEAAGAGLLPTVMAKGSAEGSGPSLGVGQPGRYGSAGDFKSERLYQGSLRANYEADFWKKNALGAESARAALDANEYDRKTVTLTLIGQVATNYFQYLLAQDRLTVARANVDNSQKTLDVLQKRAAIQEATAIQIAQQRAALARAQAQIPALELRREQIKDQLALLLGMAPGQLTLTGTSLEGLVVPQVKPGLPSDLLTRRPDIARSEAQLRAANANIGVARANYLPSFVLTAEGGQGSAFLSRLLSPGGLFYSLLGSVGQTVFDGGKTDAQVEGAKARFEEMTHLYRQTVLTALQETEDSLFSVHYLGEQEKADAVTASAARQAHEQTAKALASGFADFMTVLDAERNRYSAEDTLAQTRYGRLASAVSLMKALGGDPAEPVKPAGDMKM